MSRETDGAPKKRKTVPKALAEAVKAEFRYRCAVSGDPYAEIHHIDGDPSNNARENLIPLCPNCHQSRVHGRAGHRLDAEALRRYRDLGYRFVATGAYKLLLRRSAYLTTGGYATMDWSALVIAYRDLRSFVLELRMGRHFADILQRRVAPPRRPNRVRAFVVGPGHSSDHRTEEADRQRDDLAVAATYRDRLDAEREAVIVLLDEILMAQDGP